MFLQFFLRRIGFSLTSICDSGFLILNASSVLGTHLVNWLNGNSSESNVRSVQC